MARREQREEAEASQARLLSARLSETHSPRDLERMDTPSPLPSSPVGRLNRIEAMQAAQGIPLSPTVQIVNQGFDFSPASFEELSPESEASRYLSQERATWRGSVQFHHTTLGTTLW